MSEKTYTSNGYTYTVQDNGTVTAKGTVSENPASRKGMSGIKPDGYDSKVDDKGHLIAARMGGVAEEYNVSAQDRGLNRGAYKRVENAEVRMAEKGYHVETEKTAYVSNPGEKPSAYMINDTITTPDGKSHTVHTSMTNMSKGDMDEIDQSMKDMEDECPKSELPEDMTPEEYSQLMDELETMDDEYAALEAEYDSQLESQPAEAPENGAAAPSEASPSLDMSEGSGVLDNDANDFAGEAPSLDVSEGNGVLDNDANDFDGSTPSVDSSFESGASYEGGASAADDMGEGSGVDGGSDSGEGSEGGDGGEGMD